MFSWLQTKLQKHYKVVFVLLFIAIIPAFILVIGDFGAGIDNFRDRESVNAGFYDIDLNTEEKQRAFFTEADLSFYIMNGGNRAQQQDIVSYAYGRAAWLHVANEHNIPGPTTEELTEFIKEMILFQNPQGQFDPVIYNSALDGLKTSRNVSEGEITAAISQDYRVNRIQDVITNPGYVLPSEVLDLLKQQNTTWSVSVAELDISAYNPEVDASDEKVQAYFDENASSYRTPDRRVISYLELKALDLQSEIEASDDDLLEYFELNRYKYETLPAANADPSAPIEEPTFAENKEKVTLDFKMEKAKIVAEDRATEIVMSVVDAERRANENLSVDSEVFKTLIQESGYEVKTTTPFGISESPIGLGWGRLMVGEAFKLVPGRFYSEPVNQGDTTYILFLNEEIEGSIPSLDEVKEKVVADFTEAELNRLRDEYGDTLQEELAAASDEENFNALAAEKNLSTTRYADFKASEPAEGLDRSLLGSFSTLGQGEVSGMTSRGDKGYFVYVSKKDVPDIGIDNEEYKSNLEALRNQYRMVTGPLFADTLIQNGLQQNQ